MAVLFSPVTTRELEGWHEPLPRHVFIICRSPKLMLSLEHRMLRSVAETLDASNFVPIIAEYVSDPGSFADRIFTLIRGSGCCFAVYQSRTRKQTMGNIFYEVGIAKLLGKPVYLVTDKIKGIPSDVSGDRHVLYDPDRPDEFDTAVAQVADNIEHRSEELAERAQAILNRASIDYELAFECIRLSILLSDNTFAKTLLAELCTKIDGKQYNKLPDGIGDYHDKLRGVSRTLNQRVSRELYKPSPYAGLAAKLGGRNLKAVDFRESDGKQAPCPNIASGPDSGESNIKSGDG